MKTKRILFITIIAIVFTCGLTALKTDDKSFEISKHLNICHPVPGYKYVLCG